MPFQYRMRAFKKTAPMQYVYWIVNDVPDFDGTHSSYTSSELEDITINLVIPVFSSAVSIPSADASHEGIIKLSGDLSGTSSSPVVSGINGKAIAPLAPNPNEFLVWDATSGKWTSKSIQQALSLPPNSVIATDSSGNIRTDLTLSMFLPPASITSFTSPVNYVLVGSALTNPSFTASYSSAPTSVKLKNNFGQPDENIALPATSFSSSQSVTKNNLNDSVVFTLSATINGVEKTSDYTFIWAYPVYYGVGYDWASYSDKVSFIKNLPYQIQPTKSKSFTADTGVDKYVYYAYPAIYGDPSDFELDGWSFVFNKVESSLSVDGIPYSVYKTDNSFGEVQVNVY